MVDRKKLALALLAGEDTDLSLEGMCRTLFSNRVPAKACYEIVIEDTKVDEVMKAMVVAGYDSKVILKLALDDDNTDLDDVVKGAAEIHIPLAVLVECIKDSPDSDLESDQIESIMAHYDISEDSTLLSTLKGIYPDMEDFDESLRDRSTPIEKRIRIMAKVLGII